MLKRLIMAGKGISCFSKIGFIDELARGDVVWRPFDLQALDEMQVGIVVASHRVLPHVTQNFVGRLARRLTQTEIAAAGRLEHRAREHRATMLSDSLERVGRIAADVLVGPAGGSATVAWCCTPWQRPSAMSAGSQVHSLEPMCAPFMTPGRLG